MALDTVLVNGRSYDFASISVIIGGVPFRGISAINYTQEQEKTNNFGTGNSPVSRGRGAIETSVSIDFSMLSFLKQVSFNANVSAKVTLKNLICMSILTQN